MDGNANERDLQTLLDAIPDYNQGSLGPWDTSYDLTGVGGGAYVEDFQQGLSDWPSSSAEQIQPGIPLSSNAGLVPQNFEPSTFSGLDQPDISPYEGGQPQWQDFGDLDLADAWDSLPLTFQFDDFLALPESPIDKQLTGNSYEATGDEQKTRKRPRIPLEAKRLLEASFEQHRHDPYLQKSDLKDLAEATHLSLRQIRTFFANARVRKLPPIQSSSPSALNEQDVRSASLSKRRRQSRTSESNSSIGSAAVKIPGRSSTKHPDPMQRFLSTSPEDEGLSEDVIRKAATSLLQGNSANQPLTTREQSSKTDAMSVSELSSNSGSGSSFASIDSATHRGPRRGRKRQRDQTDKQPKTVVRAPNPSKIYQCSFCTSDFTQKYDWRRHEESVHFPQKEWICMPDGPAYTSEDGTNRCVLCNEPLRFPSHFESHNCAACLANPRADRAFTRKDKLLQHIVQVHKVCQFENDKKLNWCRPIQHNITITCGICGSHPANWAERSDHLANHFVEGQGMQYWIGPPGGIVANISTNGESGKDNQSASAQGVDGIAPQHGIRCPICNQIEPTHLAAVYHKRTAHSYYCITKQNAPYRCPTPAATTPPPATPLRHGVPKVTDTTFGVSLQAHPTSPQRFTERSAIDFDNNSPDPAGQSRSFSNYPYNANPAPLNTNKIPPNTNVNVQPATSLPFTHPAHLASLMRSSRGDVEFPTRGHDSFAVPPASFVTTTRSQLINGSLDRDGSTVNSNTNNSTTPWGRVSSRSWDGVVPPEVAALRSASASADGVLPPRVVGENGAPNASAWGDEVGGGKTGSGGSGKVSGRAIWGPWGPHQRDDGVQRLGMYGRKWS